MSDLSEWMTPSWVPTPVVGSLDEKSKLELLTMAYTAQLRGAHATAALYRHLSQRRD